MPFTRLIPMLFSVLVLAAHFLRTGPMILVLLCLIVPLTLFVRRMWALRLVQMFLLLGAAEWLRTLIVLVGDRQAQGEPWLRLVFILGAVAAFTAGSAFILQAKKARAHYGAASDADKRRMDRVGGGVTPAVLPHHRTCGSASGGSLNTLESSRRIEQRHQTQTIKE